MTAAKMGSVWQIALTLIALGLCALNLKSADHVDVDYTIKYQTLYGFGAGMKRQTLELHSMVEPQRSEVLNLMFRDVDTRILRTYLRAAHEKTNDNNDPFVLNASSLDFSAYTNDLWLVQQALSLAGPRLDTIYSSCNTGPAWMKDVANTTGGTLLQDTNTYHEFGEFLWGYLLWMKFTNGIDIGALSMFNEPDFITTHDSMNPGAAQAADIFAVVSDYLSYQTLATPALAVPLLLGPDCSSVNSSTNYLKTFLNNPGAAAALDVIGSHYYGGSFNDWVTLNRAEDGHRMVWMTEYAHLSGASDDIADGLLLAGKIHDVLTAGSHAYIAFQWIDNTTNASEGNGLIRIQPDAYVVPKRYFVFKQWANQVPRGAQRLACTTSAAALKVSAYLWPDRNTVTVQVINDTASDYPNLLFNCTAGKGPVQRYLTTATLSCARLPVDLTPTNNSFADSISANSLTTYVITADDNLRLQASLNQGRLQVSYPVWAADVPLLSSYNLNPLSSWVSVTNAVVTNGPIVTIPLDVNRQQQFFQLRLP